mgnify:FL=1|tara:strand:- start:1987 stop:2439 length:453 start_codon:yes stop_codon:yes gene_type:complete
MNIESISVKKTIVYVDGVFDLTHYGHYNLFKQAKTNGDILFVGVLSDIECENYKRKPILTEEERYNNVGCSRDVDMVIKGVPNVVSEEFINKYNIDIVCHAHTLEEHDKYKYQYIDAMKLNKFRRLEYTTTISTTDIINRIKERYINKYK